MSVVMQLDLILKYFKTAFYEFKVFSGLSLHHLTTSTVGWVGWLRRLCGGLVAEAMCWVAYLKLETSSAGSATLGDTS